jgi:hypothetical protein
VRSMRRVTARCRSQCAASLLLLLLLRLLRLLRLLPTTPAAPLTAGAAVSCAAQISSTATTLARVRSCPTRCWRRCMRIETPLATPTSSPVTVARSARTPVYLLRAPSRWRA